MSNDSITIIICLVICSFCCGGGVSSTIEKHSWQKLAIEHGAAHYNSTNATFEWNK